MNKCVIGLLILFVIISFVLILFPQQMDLSHFLAQMAKESDIDIAYAQHSTLMIQDTKLHIYKILQNHSQSAEFGRFVAVQNERVWFVYIEPEDKSELWCLASVAIDGTDYMLHYVGHFRQNQGGEPFCIRNRCSSDYFTEQSCYYYGEKIVLTDHVKLVEYSMSTGDVSEFSPADYAHPEAPYKTEISNHSVVSISSQTQKHIITVDHAAEKSEAFRRLLELSDRKIWDGSSSLRYLFDSVLFDGQKLYVICRVLNFYGETHIVAFHFDSEKESLQYIFNYLNGDVVSDGFYLVPVVQ